MTVLKDYEVTEDRFIAQQHRKVGDSVRMTEIQAKYYMQPHGTGLKASGVSKEAVGGLDSPKVTTSTEAATGKPGK